MTSKTIRYEPPLLGKLRVTIHRCCQLSCEAPQKADELFPWVLVCVGDSEECTLAQPFGQDVIWEHTVELPVRDPLGFLDVEVFSGKGIKRSGLGSAEVDLNGLIQDQETTVWLGLQGPREPGKIQISLQAQGFGRAVGSQPVVCRKAPTLSKISIAPIIKPDICGSPITDEQLRAKFSEWDVDNKGWLWTQEFMEGYQKLEDFGLQVPLQLLHETFNKYNILGDGKVSYDEFCVLMLQAVHSRV
jgi:hypothetical protein|uniref:C2 domain-containing protein n=1 Tax=Eutreptiella gymnastica TaxID=73025 RepID=A0A7S4FIM1_9EUGL